MTVVSPQEASSVRSGASVIAHSDSDAADAMRESSPLAEFVSATALPHAFTPRSTCEAEAIPLNCAVFVERDDAALFARACEALANHAAASVAMRAYSCLLRASGSKQVANCIQNEVGRVCVPTDVVRSCKVAGCGNSESAICARVMAASKHRDQAAKCVAMCGKTLTTCLL